MSNNPTVAAHLARQPTIAVLGVRYLHLWLDDGSDLYVTQYGRRFTAHLLPDNHWADKAWRAEHSEKLRGTSALYRITTKEVSGRSKDIVLKWNRMGQDIPGETESSDPMGAEFNSPFEEFSLVAELRDTSHESPGHLGIHKPLAIYVPRRYVESARMGRKQHRLEAIQRRHGDIVLDPNRQYAVIYEWIEGTDAAEALEQGLIGESAMKELVLRSRRELDDRGFRVRDSKPHHLILDPTRDGRVARDGDERIIFTLVDFELLERTPQHEQTTRDSKRKSYLARQARRFEAKEPFPPGIMPVTIMGVEYVYGPVESTGGALWVVGKDPMLFEYFLPEKWRKTPRTRLSATHEVYYTVTKDNIRLVWRVSKVGKQPDVDSSVSNREAVMAHGYNSPFEEIALSFELASHGSDTTYPRAVYMTGHKPQCSSALPGSSRYASHQSWTMPDGHPILSPNHDYVSIWGYWNGPDEALAAKDEDVCRGINALDALKEGYISQQMYVRVMQTAAQRLAALGIQDLNFRGNHVLLSIDRSGRIVRDPHDVPTMRLCNFELLKRTGGAGCAP